MTERELIWSVVVLLSLGGVLLWDILFQRQRAAVLAARLHARRSELQPALIAYINEDLELDRLLNRIGPDRVAVETLILHFLERLAGVARERLVTLAQVLGLVDAAVAQLGNVDWTQRDVAANKLGTYAVPQAVEPLSLLLADRILEVRYTAARSLGLIGSQDALAALLDILDRPGLLDGTRVLEIVQSMRRQTYEPLRAILFSEDYPLRSKLIAIDLVGDVKDYDAVGLLHEVLQSSNKEKVVRALKALAKIGHPRSIEEILAGAWHNDWEVRAQAMKAIGQLELVEGVPLLEGGLIDPSYWVRRNAAAALTRFTEGLWALDRAVAVGDEFAHDIARYELEKVAV